MRAWISRLRPRSRRGVGGVPHERVLEAVGRVGWGAVAGRSARPRRAATVRRRASSRRARKTAASRSRGNSRPIAAAVCATSLTGASRSRRASSESWSVAGIASAGSGPRSCHVWPSSSSWPLSSTVLASSSRNRGTPSALATIWSSTGAGSALPPVTRSIMAALWRGPRRSKGNGRHVAVVAPRRLELRPERDHEQDGQPQDAVDDEVELLEAGRVDPMRVLDQHQHRASAGETDQLLEPDLCSLALRPCGPSEDGG